MVDFFWLSEKSREPELMGIKFLFSSLPLSQRISWKLSCVLTLCIRSLCHFKSVKFTLCRIFRYVKYFQIEKLTITNFRLVVGMFVGSNVANQRITHETKSVKWGQFQSCIQLTQVWIRKVQWEQHLTHETKSPSWGQFLSWSWPSFIWWRSTPKFEKIVKLQFKLAIKVKYEVNILPMRQNHLDSANFQVEVDSDSNSERTHSKV